MSRSLGRSFRRHGSDVRMQLAGYEVELLRATHRGLDLALTDPDPNDPVIARLFPSAVIGDDAADEQLREMLREDLLQSRRAGLDALVELLDRGSRRRDGGVRLDLTDDEPMLVLGVLNDLRIALGARIGIETLERAEVEADDPVASGSGRENVASGSGRENIAYRLAVMDHLAYLQEQLLAVLDPPAVSVHDELGPDDLEP